MAAKKKPKPKQIDLIENREIKELNEAALEYAAIRDERQQLTIQETGLKSKVLALMHKKNLNDYVFEGIEIHVVMEEENVKVKIPKKKKDEEAE
jgi:hypothetical protein